MVSSIRLGSEIDSYSDCSFLLIVTARKRLEARSMPWLRYSYMEYA